MVVDAIWLREQADLTLTRLLPTLNTALARLDDGGVLLARLHDHFADAFETYFQLYSSRYDFYYHLEQALLVVAARFEARSAELKALDAQREADPNWFQSERMVGAIYDPERFGEDVHQQVPYLDELGITYLHVISLPDQLAPLADELRAHGISLALNLTLDLTPTTPEAFLDLLDEILALANDGVEVLCLDAGESSPHVHAILRALNAFTRMTCPALLFQSNADFPAMRRSVDAKECALADNPTLTTAIWEALATRSVDYFRHILNRQFPLPPGCAWVNYACSPDAIRWSIADDDAADAGLNVADHRYFLNLFYLGRFPGTFAAGLPFDFNPRTQEMSISGTTAALAGLEKANKLGDPAYRDTALRRLILIYSVIFSVGGIPALYLGDEIGVLNDSGYRSDPARADDSRWAHRAAVDAAQIAHRTDDTTVEGQIFGALLHLIDLRKRTPALADGETHFIHTGNPHVLGYTRRYSLLVLANVSEFLQQVDVNTLQNQWSPVRAANDLIRGEPLPGDILHLEPYQFMWLVERTST